MHSKCAEYSGSAVGSHPGREAEHPPYSRRGGTRKGHSHMDSRVISTALRRFVDAALSRVGFVVAVALAARSQLLGRQQHLWGDTP